MDLDQKGRLLYSFLIMTNLRRCIVPLAIAVAYWLTTGTSPVGAWTEATTLTQDGPAIKSVSYNGQEFLSSFNSAKDGTRLVLVFSPT